MNKKNKSSITTLKKFISFEIRNLFLNSCSMKDIETSIIDNSFYNKTVLSNRYEYYKKFNVKHSLYLLQRIK